MHTAAKRWVSAVNNWAELRRSHFQLCRDPQLLGKEMSCILRTSTSAP